FCMTVAAAILALGGCAPPSSVDDDARSSGTTISSQFKAVSKAAITLPHRSLALPPSSLLQRQPQPDCTFRGPLSNPITAEETRMKLDYEAQCYRQAESIVRTRLQQLQDYSQNGRCSTRGTPSLPTDFELAPQRPGLPLLHLLCCDEPDHCATTECDFST